MIKTSRIVRTAALFAALAIITSVRMDGRSGPGLAGLMTADCMAADEPIDPQRARQLMQRSQAGEKLSPEDQAYLDRVRQELQKRGKQKQGGGKAGPPGVADRKFAESLTNLVPLIDLQGMYKGEDGGLYGGGKNEAPAAHQAAYRKESSKVQPLDADGRPAKDGKIGLITIGFSNTSIESNDFKTAADADADKSPRVVVVNGAIGSRSAVMWAYDGADLLPKGEQERLDKAMDIFHMPKDNRKGSPTGGKDTWPTLAQRLTDAGLAPAQVQVVWMKQVEAGARNLGEFPAHARGLEADMAAMMIIAKKKYPNLRVAYVSSRTFGGWAGPASGSPEPYAYESGFAVRWMIQSQIKGEAALNYDPARGEVKAPLLLWGPYLWAQGDTPRKADGMVWTEFDVRSNDHMHPSDLGCKKVTAALLKMFKTDPAARAWFVKQ